jgi:hypothetical protein
LLFSPGSAVCTFSAWPSVMAGYASTSLSPLGSTGMLCARLRKMPRSATICTVVVRKSLAIRERGGDESLTLHHEHGARQTRASSFPARRRRPTRERRWTRVGQLRSPTRLAGAGAGRFRLRRPDLFSSAPAASAAVAAAGRVQDRHDPKAAYTHEPRQRMTIPQRGLRRRCAALVVCATRNAGRGW